MYVYVYVYVYVHVYVYVYVYVHVYVYVYLYVYVYVYAYAEKRPKWPSRYSQASLFCALQSQMRGPQGGAWPRNNRFRTRHDVQKL